METPRRIRWKTWKIWRSSGVLSNPHPNGVRGINRTMEIIDSHTHWGPSVSMRTESRPKNFWGRRSKSMWIDCYLSISFYSAGRRKLMRDFLTRPKESTPLEIPAGIKLRRIIVKSNPVTEQRALFLRGKKNLSLIITFQKRWNRFPRKGILRWKVALDARYLGCSSTYQFGRCEINKIHWSLRKIDLPLFWGGIFLYGIFVRKTKNLKIIIPIWGCLEEIRSTSSLPSRQRECLFWYCLANSGTIMRFIEKIGHERILFGSDIPLERWNGIGKSSLLSSMTTKEWILSKNLKRLIDGINQNPLSFQTRRIQDGI